MTCAQCGSAAITEDDRPWWRDDLCAACNWRARSEGLRSLIEQNNRRCYSACMRRRTANWLGCGFADCGGCPIRYIIELPKEQG